MPPALKFFPVIQSPPCPQLPVCGCAVIRLPCGTGEEHVRGGGEGGGGDHNATPLSLLVCRQCCSGVCVEFKQNCEEGEALRVFHSLGIPSEARFPHGLPVSGMFSVNRKMKNEPIRCGTAIMSHSSVLEDDPKTTDWGFILSEEQPWTGIQMFNNETL
ncbi:hypothetical protein Baya_2428 [Bagarius yarrelli]|uniref:Uncharacterized protein n=1 Tax=Bagarius yarrelli TaxID=175774 RepID=A0A556TNY3_BAGYA|nr:hypothetical protein Baya_2428 [Bagarius yarrelli]